MARRRLSGMASGMEGSFISAVVSRPAVWVVTKNRSLRPALHRDRRRAFAPSAVESPARASRGGARTAVIEAIHRLTTRAGSDVVTIQESDDLRRSASPRAESTIRTVMASYMCAQANGPGIGNQDDFDRIDRGRYRLREPRRCSIHAPLASPKTACR